MRKAARFPKVSAARDAQQHAASTGIATTTSTTPEGQEWLRQVSGLLDHRMTYQQHGELLSVAAILAVVVGSVEYDSGQQTAAETTGRLALELGTELDVATGEAPRLHPTGAAPWNRSSSTTLPW